MEENRITAGSFVYTGTESGAVYADAVYSSDDSGWKESEPLYQSEDGGDPFLNGEAEECARTAVSAAAAYGIPLKPNPDDLKGPYGRTVSEAAASAGIVCGGY